MNTSLLVFLALSTQLAASDADNTLVIVDSPAVESAADSTFSSVRMTREWSSRLLVDTQADRKKEDAVEFWNIGRLGIDYRASERWRLVMNGWLRWGGVAQAALADRLWTAEVELREGYSDYTYNGFNLKIGQRIFTWGKNEFGAAADVLNPLDVRYDPLASLIQPTQLKVPVFALDAAYNFEQFSLQLVVLPFFSGHRGFLLGRDFAFAPPNSALAQQIDAMVRSGRGAQDQLQQNMMNLGQPARALDAASVALRATTSVAGWDIAGTVYNGWDRTPRLSIDHDLRTLLAASSQINADASVLIFDPDLAAASSAVQQKLRDGKDLVSPQYRRMWQLAAEAEGVIGDVVVRGDFGFSPGQSYYTQQYQKLWCKTLRGALGAEYSRGETWFVSTSIFGSSLIDCPRSSPIVGLENNLADIHRSWAAMWGVATTARYSFVDADLNIGVNGLYTPRPGDYLVDMYVQYTRFVPHQLRLGWVTLGGRAGTLGQRFGANDYMYADYRVAW